MNAKGFDLVTVQLGGMDTRLRPASGTASLIENLRYHPGDGTWYVMEGTVSIGSLTTTGVGLFWFQPRPHHRFLVVERRTNATTNALSWLNLQSGSLSAIATRRRVENDDSGAEVFVELGRWLYFTSAFNAPMRWDGSNTVPVGFDRSAPAPEAYGPAQGVTLYDKASGSYASTFNTVEQRGVGERITTASEDGAFKYAYGLTILNDLGQESPMSPLVYASGESASGTTGKRMVRIRIPRLPLWCRGFRLWRSVNLAGTQGTADFPVYLHSEYPAAHGCDLVDHAPDNELGLEFDPDTVGAVPTGARAMAFWQGSLWMGGSPDDPFSLRFSHPLYPEQFPEVYRLRVGSRNTGHILAIVPVPRGLVVLKTHGVYMVKGSRPEDYHIEVVDETIGCAARRAVAYVPRLGLLWLHASGPQLLTGTLDDDQPTKVEGIADELTDYWRRLVQGTRIEAAVAVHDPGHHEVWFHLPHQGDNRPSLGLVLHTATGAWSTRRSWNISGFDYYQGSLYAVGWGSSGVYKFTRGSRTPNLSDGSTITGLYATNPIAAERPYSVDKMYIHGRALGSGNTFDVYSRVDRAELWTLQNETAGRYTRHMMRNAPEWGTALWGASGYWNDEDTTQTPVSLRTRAGYLLELRVQSTARMSLAELALSVQTDNGGPPPRERP